MTFQKLLKLGEERLLKEELPDAKTEAWILLSYVGDINRSEYFMHLSDEVEKKLEENYNLLIGKRIEGTPLQYITGEQEFMGLDFLVNPSVLIPRQDTELLVEEALKVITPRMRVLDLCTGSGCIAISIAKMANNHNVYASDISPQALEIVAQNSLLNQVNVTIIQSDLFEDVKQSYFDVIVSNPPYIRTNVIEELQPEVRKYEPQIALDGKEDGLYFYRKISREASRYLCLKGYLFLEIGYDQGVDVIDILREDGYQDVQLMKDLAHNDRLIIARMKKEKQSNV